MGIRTVVVVGDDDRVKQAVALAKKPHIVVATPGRLDHSKATKGFNNNIKFMIFDEAGRLLDSDFGVAVDGILKTILAERITYLFSATLTDKVARLQRANLRNPVKVQVSTKLHPHPLINKRALNRFKGEGSRILVATDIASRGLDIPSVDIVVNYDCSTHSKDYIHRVGRTARAGRSGKSILMTTQYDVEFLRNLEKVLDRKLDLYPQDSEEVDLLHERVGEAGRVATNPLREEKSMGGKRARKRKQLPTDGDNEEEIDGDPDPGWLCLRASKRNAVRDVWIS
ncbi:hypothetical protein AAF712_009362 [Marasmius tenuissimus]|uniref:Uncharacterized protein n=1 Tax=Marasmius tenuissimus TaxID=585030 RepID=A0ABR2ZQS2_9AGAR